MMAVLGARARSREGGALVALAVLNLAAMASPAAWGDYVPVGTLWLEALLVAGVSRRAVAGAVLAVTGVMSFALPGVVPIGDFPPAAPSMVLSIVLTLMLVAFNGWVVGELVRVEIAAAFGSQGSAGHNSASVDRVCTRRR